MLVHLEKVFGQQANMSLIPCDKALILSPVLQNLFNRISYGALLVSPVCKLEKSRSLMNHQHSLKIPKHEEDQINKNSCLVPTLVPLPVNSGLAGEQGLKWAKRQGVFWEKHSSNLTEHQQLCLVTTFLQGFTTREDWQAGVKVAQHHVLSQLEEGVVHQRVKIFSSQIGVKRVEEDDVHIADHEDGLDGDGGEEVDGGLVEEEIVADSWDQCKMAAAFVVESLKSYVTYLLQNILRKSAETIVNSIVLVHFLLPLKRQDLHKAVERKVERQKADEDMDPADKINPHLILVPFHLYVTNGCVSQ